MRYSGLRPPQLNSPVIEVETDHGVVDLYNDAYLTGVRIFGGTLSFGFREAGTNRALSLQFETVTGLRVDQPSDWQPGEAEQIEHLLIRPDGPWPAVAFKAGGLEYEFSAESLAVVM